LVVSIQQLLLTEWLCRTKWGAPNEVYIVLCSSC